MPTQKENSEFRARVHLDPVANFKRKLSSAESQNDLMKVLQSIEFASARQMIDPTDRTVLDEFYRQRAQKFEE